MNCRLYCNTRWLPEGLNVAPAAFDRPACRVETWRSSSCCSGCHWEIHCHTWETSILGWVTASGETCGCTLVPVACLFLCEPSIFTVSVSRIYHKIAMMQNIKCFYQRAPRPKKRPRKAVHALPPRSKFSWASCGLFILYEFVKC